MKAFLDGCARTTDREGRRRLLFEYGPDSPWASWLESGSAKVCVYVDSEAQLLDVYERARAADLVAAMVVDAGRTEFSGVPTRTVVAVGPGSVEDVDAITGDLPLY